MELGPRKFFKFFSLSFVFNVNEIHDETLGNIAVFDTSENGFNSTFLTNYVATNRVNKHTIMFITANDDDEQLSLRGYEKYVEVISKTPSTIEGEEDDIKHHFRKVHAGDTMIWARGHLYCVSTKTVVNVEFDTDERKMTFTYNDGTTEVIDLSIEDYEGIFPIKVDTNPDTQKKEISLEDIYYDRNRNIVFGSGANSTSNLDELHFVHIEGENNSAVTDYQHVEGKFALVDNRYIFIIGGGASGAPMNLFTITFDGVAHAKNDVTAGGTAEHPDFKLSDIHSVLDEDWAYLGNRFADFTRSYSDRTFEAEI